MQLEKNREKFIEIYNRCITREGAQELLTYLLSDKSDFFSCPASTRFHGSYEGGLLEHSLNVYECLCEYLKRQRVRELYQVDYPEESVAIVGLLHDLCKINCYTREMRNKKDENGKWVQVPTYGFDDKLPYGHGEKSVYIISGYMKLTREEAFAIRYHMGFSGIEENYVVGKVLQSYPLAFAVSVADMEASYFLEK